MESPLAWGRGLKSMQEDLEETLCDVAPFAGSVD